MSLYLLMGMFFGFIIGFLVFRSPVQPIYKSQPLTKQQIAELESQTGDIVQTYDPLQEALEEAQP